MAQFICQHGDCEKYMEGGEGVTITGAGFRKKFCSWEHAAKWALAMASRFDEQREDGRHLRALAELLGAKEVKS